MSSSWRREQLFGPVSSCLLRCLCSRCASTFMLLVLVITFITFQNLFTRQTRDEKPLGPHSRAVNRQQQFHTLWKVVQSLSPEKFSQAGAAEVLLHEREEREALINASMEPQVEGGLRRLLLPAEWEQKSTCSPKTHIVFLKTHKTGSSTILNILYRYGESRNLTFALPLKGHTQLFYPSFFNEDFVEGFQSQTVKEFHIMCNHMRFRQPQISRVMPEDTFYFSIMRHPVAMMESIYSYYRTMRVFRKTYSLDHLLEICQRDLKSLCSEYYFSHNILAFDFGHYNNVSAHSPDLEERAFQVIEAIDQHFDLILIADYFDESLILLRHALCWSLDDVVSFKLNSRSQLSREALSADTAEKIKHWNALDWRIYLHFKKTFRYKVNNLIGAEQMKREVLELRALRDKLATTCLIDGGAVDPAQIRDRKLRPFQSGKAVIQGYNVNPLLDLSTKTKCQRLVTPELQYTDLLYRKQFSKKQNTPN